MLTTTPRLSPCAGALPSPAMRSSPPARTSATTAITFAVPMSSPTTRSLYSFAMVLPVLLLARRLLVGRVERGRDALQAHRVAVEMAQVGVLERPLVAIEHL